MHSSLLRSLVTASVLFLLAASGLHAQTWSTKRISSVGDTTTMTFPPPDSTFVHNKMILKFYNGGLYKDSLCYDCSSIVEMRAKSKGEEPLVDSDGYYDDYNVDCHAYLRYQKFTVGIIQDPVIRTILTTNGVDYLMRMSADNPCGDTASITRTGDTIPMDHYNWIEAHFNNDTNVTIALEELAIIRPASLQLVSPVFLYSCSRIPNDPEFLNAPQRNLTMMGVPDAWNYTTGWYTVPIAVVDDCLDYRRCDLGGSEGPLAKVGGGWDFNYCDTCNPITGDPRHFWYSDTGHDYGHGTAVASILGALTNNTNCTTGGAKPKLFGMAGIDGGWPTTIGLLTSQGGAELFGYRCANDSALGPGNENPLQGDWLISAILEAVGNSTKSHNGPGACIVNCSWQDGQYDPAMRAACSDAFREGTVMVVAKGNQVPLTLDSGFVYPADFDPQKDIISVGAADISGIREFYSMWNNDMDFLAPAGDQYDSSDFVARAQSSDVDTFLWFSGTSAAAPAVSGAVGLLISWYDSVGFGGTIPYPEDWEGMLDASAEDINSSALDTFYSPPSPFDVDPGDGEAPAVPYPAGYDTRSGWGLVQIGTLFHMLDPDKDAYVIEHVSGDSTHCHFGVWGDTNTPNNAWVPLEDDGFPGSLPTGRYSLKSRAIIDTLYFSSDFNLDKPIYVWGVGGKHYGWSAAYPNDEEPWSVVINGLGGLPQLENFFYIPRREGIQHDNSSRMVVLKTFQYDIEDTMHTIDYGHFPPDSVVGVSCTVFGSKVSTSSVKQKTATTTGMSVYPSITDKSTTLQLDPVESPKKLTVTNDIGIVVSEQELSPSTSSLKLNTEDFANGFYFLWLTSSQGTSTLKFFVRH